MSFSFVPKQPLFALEVSISCLFFAFPYTAYEQREIKSEEDWKQRQKWGISFTINRTNKTRVYCLPIQKDEEDSS